MNGTRDEFPYFECTDCGCVSLVEIPENLGEYYKNGYYSLQKQSCSRIRLAAYQFSLSRLLLSSFPRRGEFCVPVVT